MDIENLQIEVGASSSEAEKKLKRLESVLERIDALGHRTGFDELYKKLKRLAKLDFSKTISGLSDIEKSTERMRRSTSRMEKFSQALKKVKVEMRETQKELVKVYGSPSYMMPKDQKRNYSRTSFGGNIGNGDPNFTAWNPWGSKKMFDWIYDYYNRNDFGNVPTGRRLVDGTIELGSDQWYELSKLDKLKKKFSRLKEWIRSVKQELSGLNGTLGNTGKQARKTGAMLGAMKTILMYSLLFSAVSAVTKGMTEGLQNVAMYSEEANKTLTEYKTTILELKNAIGSALVPALQVAYPLLDSISRVLIEAANSVNILTSAISGSSTFIRAKKHVDDYAKSLGKAKSMLGMDQINTLGKTTDFSDMYETVEIDAASIAEALFDIVTLGSGIGGIKNIICGGGWSEGFSNIGTHAASLADNISSLLRGLSFSLDEWTVGSKEKINRFFEGIIEAVKKFSPGIALALALDIVREKVGFVIDFVNASFGWVITQAGDFISLLGHLLSGDFEAAWEDVKKWWSDFWKGFANILITPINFMIGCFEALVNFFIRGINMIIGAINMISFTIPEWVPGIGGRTVGFDIKEVAEISLGRIEGFSSGGFPEDGLFMANHGELVGKFSNGRTAVANNEQIIEGIKRGVKEANEESGGGGGNWIIQIVDADGSVKAETIITAAERRNRRDGKTIIPIGV